jgi:hypothetical protein
MPLPRYGREGQHLTISEREAVQHCWRSLEHAARGLSQTLLEEPVADWTSSGGVSVVPLSERVMRRALRREWQRERRIPKGTLLC